MTVTTFLFVSSQERTLNVTLSALAQPDIIVSMVSINNRVNVFFIVYANLFMPLLLDKIVRFLPLLLVLGGILDDFRVFLPLLLDIFYNFAPDKANVRML